MTRPQFVPVVLLIKTQAEYDALYAVLNLPQTVIRAAVAQHPPTFNPTPTHGELSSTAVLWKRLRERRSGCAGCPFATPKKSRWTRFKNFVGIA